jgi:hypothetical protein
MDCYFRFRVEHLDIDRAHVAADPFLEDFDQELPEPFGADRPIRRLVQNKTCRLCPLLAV